MVNVKPRRFASGKGTSVPTEWQAGWNSGPFREFFLEDTVFETRTIHPVAYSLFLLHYGFSVFFLFRFNFFSSRSVYPLRLHDITYRPGTWAAWIAEYFAVYCRDLPALLYLGWKYFNDLLVFWRGKLISSQNKWQHVRPINTAYVLRHYFIIPNWCTQL